MSLSPQMVKLKLALEAAGVVVGNSQDVIVSTATGWILETTARAQNIDSHSSGPQFDAPAKPKRIKKLP